MFIVILTTLTKNTTKRRSQY